MIPEHPSNNMSVYMEHRIDDLMSVASILRSTNIDNSSLLTIHSDEIRRTLRKVSKLKTLHRR